MNCLIIFIIVSFLQPPTSIQPAHSTIESSGGILPPQYKSDDQVAVVSSNGQKIISDTNMVPHISSEVVSEIVSNFNFQYLELEYSWCLKFYEF